MAIRITMKLTWNSTRKLALEISEEYFTYIHRTHRVQQVLTGWEWKGKLREGGKWKFVRKYPYSYLRSLWMKFIRKKKVEWKKFLIKWKNSIKKCDKLHLEMGQKVTRNIAETVNQSVERNAEKSLIKYKKFTRQKKIK